MDAFDLAPAFVERTAGKASAGASREQLNASFQKTLEHLGFRYFACCSHVDPQQPPPAAIVLHNYPPGWAIEFCERKLYQVDPVLLHAERVLTPFHWDAPDFRARTRPAQRDILRQAADLGLDRGYTIPIHLPWAPHALRAFCSVVPDTGTVDAQLLASPTHRHAFLRRGEQQGR